MMDTAQENIREADRQHAEALARIEHTVSLARGGLQAALLANGGALIGLFTLIAPHRDLAADLWRPGLAFSAALLFTLFSWLCATFSQDRLQLASTYRVWLHEAAALGRAADYPVLKEIKRGNLATYLAYGFIITSFALFIAGCLMTLKALA